MAYVRQSKAVKSAKGKREWENLRAGNKITHKQAIEAMCYECCGFYEDGKVDCESAHCPLYHFMPYRGKNGKRTKKETNNV